MASIHHSCFSVKAWQILTSERGDGVGLGKSPVNATARLSTGKVVELEDMVFVEVDESSVQ